MKKITFLLSFIACVLVAQAQTNLLVNPSFEAWTQGVPDGWTLQTPTAATITAEPTILNDGAKSLKIATTATYPVWQSVPVTAGKTYTLSMSYYIVSGDGSDARTWCNFKNGTSFLSNDALGATLLGQLKGPDNLYFADERGAWKTYNIEFTAPADVTDFNFEFRTYTAAVVYWDKMFFGEKVFANVNNTNTNSFKAIVSGKNLMLQGVKEGAAVEIYSAIGSKVLSAVVANGKIDMSSVTKGLYVVRIDKQTQKILF